MSRHFLWESSFDVESDTWTVAKQNGQTLIWRLRTWKLANTSRVHFAIKLHSAHNNQRQSVESFRFYLYSVPVTLAQAGGPRGYIQPIPFFDLINHPFPLGVYQGQPDQGEDAVGFTLAAIQRTGCYNAHRDSILLYVTFYFHFRGADQRT